MWNWPLISLVAFIGFLISCRSWTWRGKVMAGICFVGLLVTTVFGITRTPDHDFIVKECGYYASQGARIGVELKKSNASGVGRSRRHLAAAAIAQNNRHDRSMRLDGRLH